MLTQGFFDEQKKVKEAYRDLVPVADDIVSKISKPLDDIMSKLKNGVDSFSTRQLNDFMLQLSIESYYFGSRKDHALLQQACADALYKEGLAKSYSTAQGTQLNRQNQATMDSFEKQIVKMLYDCTANMMKTKLDEAHRTINVLNSAIISRNAEAKMNTVREENNNIDVY